MALVKINVPGRVGVFCELGRDLCAALGRNVADHSAPEVARPGVMPVDGRLYALWATQVGGISHSVVHWVSPGGVSLGPHEPRVAHLLPMVSVDAVVARILLRSFLFPLTADFPGVATSPALTLWLLLSACRRLAMLQLQLPGAPFPISTSCRAVQMVSGSRERSVTTGATAPSRNQNMRLTVYRLSFL